jgi:hypothetical protein
MNPVRRLMAFLTTEPKQPHALPKGEAAMSEDDARRIAHQWAIAHRQWWEEPIRADYVRHEEGWPCWVVQSNWSGQGFSLIVTIEDATGKVVATHTLPR